jgi:hypothetical protein
VCDVCGVSKHLRELDAAPKEVVRRGGVPDFVETLQQQDRQKMLAKFVNNVPVLSRLLSDRIYHEFDINYTDPITGDSALHKAAKLGNLLSCQCLIQVRTCSAPPVLSPGPCSFWVRESAPCF